MAFPAALDLQVEAAKAARNRPAVLKLEIANLRSTAPTLPILVFEGDDDKIVYYHWIDRIRPRWRYTSFPCGGKGKLLRLRTSIQNDATGLSAGVYFFVDRDFDELKGQDPGPDVFMTDAYSVENYLVTPEVLDKVLEIEFHCHNSPKVRERIKDLFLKSYEEFLVITRGVNRRLYNARRGKIEINSITDTVNDIANIGLDTSSIGRLRIEQIISARFRADDAALDSDEFKDEFEQLDPRSRYRGKFAMIFLWRWLHILLQENEKPERGAFSGIKSKAPFRFHELGLNCYASRSSWPQGLDAFITQIEAPAAE